MYELFEIMQSEWALRALIASSLVGVMCGVLGSFIVLRNMSMIGDALAHAILPGVVFAYIFVGVYSVLAFFIGAVLAGLISALLMTWIQQNVNTKNDAAIGIVFTAMFSIGVMAISYISQEHGVHLDLKDFLFGNILGVANEDLWLTGAIAFYVLLSIILFYRYLFVTTFQPVIAETMGISTKIIHYFLMLLLSFAVVASLRTVGVILVVAMLITPASTALLLSNRLKQVVLLSGIIGLFSAVVGLILAIKFETTPGPAMTVTATVIYLLAVFFAPEKGLLFKYLNKRNAQKRIFLEDTLKQVLKLHEKGVLSLSKLVDRMGAPLAKVKANVQLLAKKNVLQFDGKNITMTEKGIQEANRLVRAHRLWETYLVQQVGLNTEQIHEDAEQKEHYLTDDILDEMEEHLGYPTVDPHGSPIPKTRKLLKHFLGQLLPGKKGIISKQQLNENITSRLWELNLFPGTTFHLVESGTDFIKIKLEQGEIELSKSLAQSINVDIVGE